MEFPEKALDSPAGHEALRIIDRLREAGFVSVLAGGCVRDALLRRPPKDFDVATDATPDSVQQVFGRRQTIAFGASFGVIGVLPPKSKEKTAATVTPTEVATFRADGNYSDGRRPDHVTYGTAEADAARRDFTINGLFYDPSRREILDYVGGIPDLELMHLRTIGNAHRRFDEDKLRMLRAVRFVTTLGLTVEESTLSAIEAHADSISLVSGERIGAEMRRVVCHHNAVVGYKMLVDTGLQKHVWPSLENSDWPLLETHLRRAEQCSFEVGMSTTLSSLHSSIRAAINDLKKIANRWRLSTAEQRSIETAIRLAPEIVGCADAAWSHLQPILIDRDIDTVIATAAALAEDRSGVDRAIRELQREPSSLNPEPLLTGNDLIQSGITPGPKFRSWLSEIRRMQLDDEIDCTDDAMAWVQRQS
ncbi:CCA tRNA nucleotidyltransferase [Rhodopirellula sallentina]|uniref:tRNA adenylyltransferase n=1 Tax=Rhodopirellula sallentina SM41 TaxID=1263870 RepID=M5U2B0_9BACT|nr:CCA tRNA nucleotidyltransferase [Rhodopirellula sallentina]EMI51991.1 tRNA adenylyltransferase [Rhodopirellula sallentina SM41]